MDRCRGPRLRFLNFFAFRLTKNSHLVEILASIQIIGLAIALVCAGGWIKLKIGSIVRQQIISDNTLIAEQLGNVIRLTQSARVEYGSEAWNELQYLVEQIELPNQGFVCIADRSSGQLLCHPELRNKPALRKLIVGKHSMDIDGTRLTILNAIQSVETKRVKPITGLLGSGAALEIVSVADLGALEAILMVHQNETASQKAVARFLTPMGFIGLVVGMALILVTTKTSLAVLKRYENELAALNRNLENLVQVRTRSLMKTRDSVIFGLAKLSESRDTDTGEHLDRIRYYAMALAKSYQQLGNAITPELIDEIGLASSLHDIGKVGVPDRVLLKPGKLDSEERLVIETHTLVGERCLEAIEGHLGQDGFLSLAKEICAYHHEKWDGSGYPYGLEGEQIPISARIVAVADVYDALRSRRPYKEPMTHEAAFEIILAGAGKHFDPSVVVALIQLSTDFEERSTGSIELGEQRSLRLEMAVSK